MTYTHRLRITVPTTLADTAAAIGRAMDPDTGGDKSFIEIDGVLVCDTPCTEEFHGQARAMLTDPALLHAVVAADYAARRADLTPPTLADCEAFVAGCEIVEPAPVEVLCLE